MDENFAYWSASLQRAGKWFSSSLALGTNVVADITDMVLSDMPCYHDRARCHCSYKKNPHGGPITHSSTGSKLDCPVHPLFPKLFLARGLVCNSRATVLVIYSGIRRNTYSRYSEPFLTLVQTSSNYLSAWNLLLYLRTLLSMYFICSTREILLWSFLGYPRPDDFPL